MKKNRNRIPRRNLRDMVPTVAKVLVQGVGAYVGANIKNPIAAPLVTCITTVLCDMAERQFSGMEAEQAKIGITSAVDTINQKLNDGERLREDGFFTKRDKEIIDGVRGRTKADKLFESMILSVKNDSEQRKAKYTGALFANLCFSTDVLPVHVNSLIKMASNLSFNDLCYLYVFRNESIFDMPDVKELQLGFPGIVAKTEVYELMKLGFIASKEERIQPNYFNNIDIRGLQVQGFGFALFELMGLENMLPLEVYEAVQPLGIKFKGAIQKKLEHLLEKLTLDEKDEGYDPDVNIGMAIFNDMITNAVQMAEYKVRQKRNAVK